MFRSNSFLLVVWLGGFVAAAPTANELQVAPFVSERGRVVTQTLSLSNPYHDVGKWGPPELCENGSFASAIEIKYNPPGHIDETAINGIKLYCSTPEGHTTGYITSTVCPHGDWYGMTICSSQFITDFRANVLPCQGIFVDDVAVENIQVGCDYGREIIDALPIQVPKFQKPDLHKFKPGTWGDFSTCRQGTAVCGLQTQKDDPAIGDKTAIDNFAMFCCSLE